MDKIRFDIYRTGLNDLIHIDTDNLRLTYVWEWIKHNGNHDVFDPISLEKVG